MKLAYVSMMPTFQTCLYGIAMSYTNWTVLHSDDPTFDLTIRRSDDPTISIRRSGYPTIRRSRSDDPAIRWSRSVDLTSIRRSRSDDPTLIRRSDNLDPTITIRRPRSGDPTYFNFIFTSWRSWRRGSSLGSSLGLIWLVSRRSLSSLGSRSLSFRLVSRQ